MITCSRCGIETPRLTLSQTRCKPCQAAVDMLIRTDTERRGRKVWRAKVLAEVVR